MIVMFLVLDAVLALAWAAFCAGAETAFLSVSRERILHLAREGGRKARKVQAALADMGHTTTTLLIGNNLASVAYSSATAALSVELFGDSSSTASALWGFFAAFTVLYVSEFMPKLMCAARPLRRSLMLAGAYEFMEFVLRPLTALAMKFTDFFVRGHDEKYKLTAHDLVRILQDRRDGVCLSDFESALVTRIVVLRVKGLPITPEALLSALRSHPDADVGHADAQI